MSRGQFGRDNRPLSTEAAKAAIERIRRGLGHITDSDREEIAKTSPKWQDGYIQEKQRSRKIAASYAKTVAKQLYSSKFRLIHELLQNADDAEYEQDVEPTITFRIYPKKLVVESSEKGFTLHNVEAICSTGQSSKVEDSNTTGEKGLGFKSVFGIANYVLVESGFWSFRFEHQEKQDGLGLISPIWTDVQSSLPAGVGTRFTLLFSDSSDEFLRRVLSHFESLPDTMIFALRNLCRMKVTLHQVLGRSGHVTFKKSDELSGRSGHVTFKKSGELSDDTIMTITTTVEGNIPGRTSKTTRLRLFSKSVQNMPAESLRSGHESVVKIALEVNDADMPVIPQHGQHVFAFLPVQRLSQLPFLIQADFVLAASREAVSDTPWNLALYDGIVEVFCDAIKAIARSDNPLNLVWMRFLPHTDIDGFWQDLHSSIGTRLSDANVLRSHGGVLRSVHDVRILPSWFFHDEEPLLPDLQDDLYLSLMYEASDVALLKGLSVEQLSYMEALHRMQPNINFIQNEPLNGDWHAKFIRLVQRLLQPKSKTHLVTRQFDIIPLKDMSWVSVDSLKTHSVYFPYSVDEPGTQIALPGSLDFRILHPDAYKDTERRRFYVDIGVSTCDSQQAIRKIVWKHKKWSRNVAITDLVAELETLFWFDEPHITRELKFDHKSLRILGADRKLHPGSALFLPSDSTYNAQKLLSNTKPTDFMGFGFIDTQVWNSQMQSRIRHDTGWSAWLQKCGMTYFPTLTTRNSTGSTLSQAIKLIAKDNPKAFVPNLKEHWDDYRHEAPEVVNELRDIRVPCQNDADHALSETLLPTRGLLETARQLRVHQSLPFLQLPESIEDDEIEHWSFLAKFGVICELNAAFYLRTLQRLKQPIASPSKHICAMIYAGIVGRTSVGDAQVLQEAFNREPLIYVPNSSKKWQYIKNCVWEGPDFLKATTVLSTVYGDESAVSDFFKKILDMRDANVEDITSDLMIASGAWDSGTPIWEAQDFRSIYTCLTEMAQDEKVGEDLCTQFRSQKLIYVGDRWYKSSECLWKSAVKISGRVTLESSYSDHRKLFVEVLRVKLMNVNVLIQELTKLVKESQPNLEEVKCILLEIGQFLAAKEKVKIDGTSLDSLLKTSFLPVRGPLGISFHQVTDDFLINDHQRYGELFCNKAKILDFDSECLTSLHPLFKLLDLQHKCLSRSVIAKTTVGQSTLSELLTAHMHDRAYSLSCCAISYNSTKYYNKDVSMHQTLLAAKVFVCKEIQTDLMVKQDHDELLVESERAVIEVKVADEELQIYVPEDSDGLKTCFHTEFPAALTSVLGIEDAAATKIVYRILNEEDKDLDAIMMDEDLYPYPWIEKPPLSAQRNLQLATETHEERQESINSANLELVTDFGGFTTRHASGSQEEIVGRLVTRTPIWQQAAGNQTYKRLLLEVQRQAIRTPPTVQGAFDTSSLMQSLPQPNNALDYINLQLDFNRARYESTEKNSRIGAAGELFVFEHLRAIGVTNFTLANWQSSIRRYIDVLPEYSRNAQWSGTEISDIMYDGNCRNLQNFLYQNTRHAYPAWLQSDIATSHLIRYHIEVKTTPGPCNHTFWVTEHQYRLMRKLACNNQTVLPPRDLYVVIRVYDLFSSNIGFQVYINPWHLKDDVLEFTAESWRVKPIATAAAATRARVRRSFNELPTQV